MGKNMTDVNFSTIKVNRDNQPIFIAANIENNPLVYFIHRRKRCTQFRKTIEFGFFEQF